MPAALTFCFRHQTKQTMLTFGLSNKLDKAVCLYYHFLSFYLIAAFFVFNEHCGTDRPDIILQYKKKGRYLYHESTKLSSVHFINLGSLNKQLSKAYTVLKMEAFHKENPSCVMKHTSYQNRMQNREHTCILTSIVMALVLASWINLWRNVVFFFKASMLCSQLYEAWRQLGTKVKATRERVTYQRTL